MSTSVGTVGRRASSSLFKRSSFICQKSTSCPDLTRSGTKMLVRTMLLNPRAPKIRHLNASHSLLIEMEKHVRKVQELECKVHELEMQLQLKELVKTHTVINQAWQAEKIAQEKKEAAGKFVVSEEEQAAFAVRLALARKKAEQLSIKRAEEEANILRSWHQKRLRMAIDKLSQIPEADAETVKMLPQPSSQVSQQDLELNTNIIHGLETLIDFESQTDSVSFQQEIKKLQQLVDERNHLQKLIEDVEMKEAQTKSAVEECQNTLYNVNAARIKLNANLKMSKTLLNTMQNVEKQRKTSNMFVFGPNPIFSSAKEYEMTYSVSNQFVIEMLKELDISYLVAERNLDSAKDCRTKYEENRNQIEESLQLVQETIDMQANKINEMQKAHKDSDEQRVVEATTSEELTDDFDPKPNNNSGVDPKIKEN